MELQPDLRVFGRRRRNLCISSDTRLPSLGVCASYDIPRRYVKGVVSRWRSRESMRTTISRPTTSTSAQFAVREKWCVAQTTIVNQQFFRCCEQSPLVIVVRRCCWPRGTRPLKRQRSKNRELRRIGASFRVCKRAGGMGYFHTKRQRGGMSGAPRGPTKDWKFDLHFESADNPDLDFRLCHALARSWLVRNRNSPWTSRYRLH